MLNVGLTANILDTRTFSMFVLHALVLTFITTPLTILFYPPKYRVHAGELPKKSTPTLEDSSSSAERDIQDSLKSRFAVVVDRIEQLPAVMTLTQLLQSPTAMVASQSESSSVTEKAALSENIPVVPHTPAATATPRIKVDALRLIELTNRTSAVLKSQAADSLALSDPVLAIFKTFGYLHRMAVTTALAVVGYEDFSENVNQHVRASGSQMVILPWTNGLGAVEDAAENSAPSANDATTSSGQPSGTAASPFDGLFQTKRERNHAQDHGSVATHSHFIRRVFADAPADVALFWDRGVRESEGEGQYHVFMPFFGGPDDRSALAFVVQLCMHPSVSATVVRMRKVEGGELEPTDTIEEIKAHNVSTFVAHLSYCQSVLTGRNQPQTIFPDTVYGAQTTQTRMASETADNLLWTKLTTTGVPELANASAHLTFREETATRPLHHVLEVASSAAHGHTRQIVVTGRSRRMAVESHQVELQRLVGERGATLGAELPKTLGHVACAFVVAGSAQASLLVIQAAQKW